MESSEHPSLVAKSPLAETALGLKSGRLDLLAYIDQACERIRANEPRIQALVPEPGRAARLKGQAERLVERFPDPDGRPPLFGVLLGVKDIFHADGFLTQAGARLPAELFQGPEASSVTALKKAGALVLGKTVTTEFAYLEPGPTRNPHNLNHTPGGSSSGSVAAVAAGFCSLALGTQTIGSTIRPAAFCGLVGFKPSFGRIARDGLLIFSRSLDQVGLFTQDAAGMGLAASIICRDWRERDKPPDRRPVLGVPEGPYLDQASPEALDAFRAQLARLEAGGCIVRRVQAFADLEAIIRRHRVVCATELAEAHSAWFEAHRDLYRPATRSLILEGLEVDPGELARVRQGSQELRAELDELMAGAGLDLWACPATLGPAPEGIGSTGDPAMNLAWTQAGLPALTLPAGRAANGLPLGLQLVAPFMADERLLGWAEGLAAALDPESTSRP